MNAKPWSAGALVTTMGAALFAAPSSLLAAGFYLQEHGMTGLGRAYAGEVAAATDASTIYFNPAGMTHLEGNELQAGLYLLIPDSRVRQTDSQIPGRNSGNPFEPSALPNLFWAQEYTEGVWLGFGLSAPFGLRNEYNNNFFARYDSLESDLTVLNLQPSIAVELNERVSIGGGIDLQYAQATLRSAIPGDLQPENDGRFDLEGDNVDLGFNIGLTFDLSEATRLGVHYRDGITHTLVGRAKITQPFNGSRVVVNGQADLDLPAIASIGIRHDLSERWTALAQYNYFEWSSFDEIRIELPTGDQVLPQNYQDSHAIALGAEYELNPSWTLRGGIQYDETPTQTNGRSTRTPDGDRLWLSAGASHAIGDRFHVDLAYSYVHTSSENLDITREFNGVPINMQGRSEGEVHVLGAALRYNY